MLKGVVLLSVLVTLATPAWAGLGPLIPEAHVPQGLCLITLQQEGAIRAEVCSGFLKDSSTLITAGHCTKNMTPETQVQCGDMHTQVQSFEASQSLDLENLEFDIPLRRSDVAVVKLVESIPVRTPKLIQNEAELLKIMHLAGRCGFFGYSRELGKSVDEEKLQLSAIEIRAKFLKIEEGVIHLDGRRGASALVQPGDSGGALACRYRGEWVFAGVVSGRDWDYQSFFAPIYNHQQLNTHQSELGEHRGGEINEVLVEKKQPLTSLYPGDQLSLAPYSEFMKTSRTVVTGFLNSAELFLWPFEHSTLDHNMVSFKAVKKVGKYWLGHIRYDSVTMSFSCLYGFVCDPGEMTWVKVSEEILRQTAKKVSTDKVHSRSTLSM